MGWRGGREGVEEGGERGLESGGGGEGLIGCVRNGQNDGQEYMSKA